MGGGKGRRGGCWSVWCMRKVAIFVEGKGVGVVVGGGVSRCGRGWCEMGWLCKGADEEENECACEE